MRVLFFGDLAGTGFGTVTTDLGTELLKQGVDVRFISQNDTGQVLPEPFRSRAADMVSLLQSFDKLTGEELGVAANGMIGRLVLGTADVKLHSGEEWGGWIPEAVILLGDYRAAQFMVDRAAEEFASIPTLHYCPIEGTDLPPDWSRLWSLTIPVAMSRFGARQIERVVGHPVPMVYHGVDTAIFRPIERKAVVLKDTSGNFVPIGSREDAKRAWAPFLAKTNHVNRIPRKWLLRTDRNMPRKQYNRLFRALAPVLERWPDWGLIVHCTVFDQGGYLSDSASKYPAVRDRILFTDANPTKPLDRETLVSLYNAADLYVSNSAEGFGLTIAEALACGVPAVGVRYSAVPEVIGPAGVTAPRFSLIDNEYDHYWCTVDELAFGKLVEELMRNDARREALGAKGPGHVTANFSWAVAAEEFRAILETEVDKWRTQLASRLSGNTSALPLPPASSEPDPSAPTSSSPQHGSSGSPGGSSPSNRPRPKRSRREGVRA
mgnify:CR=1 FL=1